MPTAYTFDLNSKNTSDKTYKNITSNVEKNSFTNHSGGQIGSRQVIYAQKWLSEMQTSL